MKKRLALVLFLLCILTVSARQPELPTYFYGLTTVNGIPAQGVTVTAIWIDNDGNLQTTSTETLTEEQAESSEEHTFTGFYLFNRGYVKAKAGSNISVVFEGSEGSISLKANPGGSAVKMPNVALTPRSLQKSTSLASKVGSLVESLKELVRSSEEKDKPENTDPHQGESESYEKDKPTKQWFQFDNDPIGESDRETDQETNVSTKNATFTEETKQAKNEPDADSKQDVSRTETIGVQQIKDVSLTRPDKKIRIRDIIFVIAGLAIAVATAIGLFKSYSIIKKVYNNIMSNLADFTIDPVKSNCRKILHTKVSELATEIKGIDKNKQYLDALTYFAESKSNILLVLEGTKYRGFISKENILKIGYGFEKSLYTLLVEHFMLHAEILASSTDSIEVAYNQMRVNEVDKLGIIVNGELRAELSLIDILKHITEFQMPKGQLPKVRDIMQTSYKTIDCNENIEKARKLMLKNQSFLIITKEDKPIGILTAKDYIINLNKIQKNLYKYNVQSLMSSPIITMDPDINIFEANEFMIKKEFNNYPVIIDNEIIGIVTQEILADELVKFLRENAY